MEQSLNPEIQPASNKKLLIGAIATVGIVIVVTFMFILASILAKKENNSQNLQPVSNNSQPVNSDNLNQKLAPSVNPNNLENWKTVKNVQYIIKYPPDWKEVENYPEGTYLVLQAPLAQNAESAHVAVQINDANRVSVASMSAGLSSLGFKKESATVAGIQAQKFSGAINFPGKIVHNNAYLFGYSGKIYFIKLSYQQPGVDAKLEQEFSQVVKTFTFR